MLFCQLGRADSLREICNGLGCCLGRLVHVGILRAPCRSTLSYANEHRPSALFEDLFFTALARFGTAPDRAIAGVGLLVFLGGRPVRVRSVFEAGEAGTITGMAAVDFQIVGADGDRHVWSVARQFREFATCACHMFEV